MAGAPGVAIEQWSGCAFDPLNRQTKDPDRAACFASTDGRGGARDSVGCGKQPPAPRKKAHCKKNIDSSSPFRPKQVDKIQRKIPIAKLSAKLPVSIFWEILWSSLGRLSVVENHVHFEVGEILYLLRCALLFGEGASLGSVQRPGV
jgi:hypothetical protein